MADSVIGISSSSRLDDSEIPVEVKMENYDLFRKDEYYHDVGVVSDIRKSLSCNP